MSGERSTQIPTHGGLQSTGQRVESQLRKGNKALFLFSLGQHGSVDAKLGFRELRPRSSREVRTFHFL